MSNVPFIGNSFRLQRKVVNCLTKIFTNYSFHHRHVGKLPLDEALYIGEIIILKIIWISVNIVIWNCYKSINRKVCRYESILSGVLCKYNYNPYLTLVTKWIQLLWVCYLHISFSNNVTESFNKFGDKKILSQSINLNNIKLSSTWPINVLLNKNIETIATIQIYNKYSIARIRKGIVRM